jgi:hypothetical protein
MINAFSRQKTTLRQAGMPLAPVFRLLLFLVVFGEGDKALKRYFLFSRQVDVSLSAFAFRKLIACSAD